MDYYSEDNSPKLSGGQYLELDLRTLSRRDFLKAAMAANGAAIASQLLPLGVSADVEYVDEDVRKVSNHQRTSQAEGVANMSTFNIYQKLEYAVILADSLGQRRLESGNVTPLLAPKLVHVAPNIYAAHAGFWAPALKMLHEVHDFVAGSTQNITHAQFANKLTSIGEETVAEYRNTSWESDILNVRIPLVVTGRYRHPSDVQSKSATSIMIWEGASNFEPERTTTRATWATNKEITALTTAIMKLPELEFLLNAGPLATARALDAVHALVAQISTFVSPESNILVVGEEEEHSLLKGQLVRLPNKALLFG